MKASELYDNEAVIARATGMNREERMADLNARIDAMVMSRGYHQPTLPGSSSEQRTEVVCEQRPAITTIFLDVDGVLVDFVSGAGALMGYDPKVVTCWDYYPLIGKTEDEFWRAIDAAGSGFWECLPTYPWFEMLYCECKKYAETILLTSPSQDPSSHHGKFLWMKRMFGSRFRDYLIGPSKRSCAGPGKILIDDSDANCEKFAAAGGQAILFPAAWNENRDLRDDPFGYTAAELAKAFKPVSYGKCA